MRSRCVGTAVIQADRARDTMSSCTHYQVKCYRREYVGADHIRRSSYAQCPANVTRINYRSMVIVIIVIIFILMTFQSIFCAHYRREIILPLGDILRLFRHLLLRLLHSRVPISRPTVRRRGKIRRRFQLGTCGSSSGVDFGRRCGSICYSSYLSSFIMP